MIRQYRNINNYIGYILPISVFALAYVTGSSLAFITLSDLMLLYRTGHDRPLHSQGTNDFVN